MSEAENKVPSGSDDALGAGPGPRLARERELQNLSATDVARQLKLSVAQVEALEAGHYHRLPGPVFVRGFIRNYARLLKLDPDQLVHSAGDSLPQQVSRPEMPASQDIPFPTARGKRWPRYAAITGVIVAGLALYEFYWGEQQIAVDRPVVLPAGPVRAPQAPVQESSDTGVPAAPSLVGPQAAPATITASAGAAETARDAAPPGASGRQKEPELVARPGERQVQLEFDDESWVEIRDGSGNTIFSRLNRAGTRQLVSGLPPLSLVVGNAHGVRLSYDKQPVDLARHTRSDVARLTLE